VLWYSPRPDFPYVCECLPCPALPAVLTTQAKPTYSQIYHISNQRLLCGQDIALQRPVVFLLGGPPHGKRV